jgi:hypothetical protein
MLSFLINPPITHDALPGLLIVEVSASGLSLAKGLLAQ